MTTLLSVTERANWRLRPGRRLRRSPRWSEADAIVVFDCASGDYWILGPDADALLFAIEVTASEADLRQDVAGQAELLADLQRCGLISRAA